ncbi:MAG: serine hydrolase [Desulfomonile tiedjei]|nr:serine hydrolase [Desulfomonile tiedjei]
MMASKRSFMNRFRVVAALAVGLTVMGGSRALSEDLSARGLLDRSTIASYIRPLIDDGSYTGIAVGIVSPMGRQAFGFGSTSRDRGRRPSGDTVYPLASITKTFTGVLLADFALRGRVRLNDPIGKYLPRGVIGQDNPLARITLLDLATHTSGLPRMPTNTATRGRQTPGRPYSVAQLYDFLTHYRPVRPPGATFEYSNIGIGLLGHILEIAGSTPYETMVERRICRPLGMESTRVTPTTAMRRRMAQGYNRQLKPVGLKPFDVGKSSGGLYSTADDMMKYLAANVGLSDAGIVKALLDAQQPRRRVPGKENAFMGLTWHVRKLRGREIVSKNGGVTGFQSFTAFSRADRVGIVALANGNPGNRSLDAAARRIFLKMLSDSEAVGR